MIIRNLFAIVLISLNIIVMVNCAPPTCYQCNSEVDDYCKIITGGESDDYLTDCVTEDTTGGDVCYTLIEGSNVKRDCLVDATPVFISDCEANSDCHVCKDNGCNEITFKPLECIACESGDNSNCATVETELTSVEQCVNIDEECYVGISTDGVTTRGCKTKDDCDAYSNGLCTSCVNSDRCNDQLYPTDRLQCKQCKSGTEADCASAPETLLATACQNYDDTELCYTILTDNHEVIRGCISDKHPETPEESECNSPNCITCDLAECNVHIIDVPQLTCIKCDSDIDPNCATVETELTSVEQCVNIDEECYVGISTDGVTTRGCKTKDDCDAYSNGLCTSCVNSDRCNDQLYPTDRLQCKQCKSGTEGDCASAPETLLATACQNYDDTELCYTILTDNHEVIRGCISDKHPETPEESECNSPNCITCDLAECNVHIIDVPQLTCIKCDSDIDPNCATVETELTSVEQCVNIDEECYVGISTDGVTTRGCKTKDDCDAYLNGLCTSCVNSNRCNDQLYPTDRLQCKQCKSGTEGDCASAPETLLATACQNYDDTELCYTILTDNHEVIRGCISDKHPETPEESECNSPNCITCDLAECNVHIIDVPQLTCIKCDSDIDPNCATVETELTSVEQCVNIDEECYVGISTDGVTTRGCKTKDDCDAYSNGLCTSCVNSDRCNDQLYPTDRLQCKQCKSGTEGDCASAPETLLATACQNYDDTELCYTILTDNHEVIRGCISDKHPETPEESECNSPNCITCDLAECNVHIIDVPQLTCIKCDSDIDPNCATVETELTSVEQCVNIDEECYVGISTDGVTTRGCKTKDDCDAYSNGLCTSCVNSDRCNDQLYPTDRLQCKQCKSGTEGDCASAPETLLATACQNYDDTELCYTILTDNHEVIRGCISDKHPETPEESECNSPNCITCDLAECNVHIIDVPQLTCIKCDSDIDPNCATVETELTSVEQCVNIDEECYVGISTDGVTTRGCKTKDDCDAYSNGLCTSCVNSDRCNDQLYPTDRLQCKQCKSGTEGDCASAPETLLATACQNYDDTELCYTILTDNHEVIRGCISDKHPETPEESECNSPNCITCDLAECNVHIIDVPQLTCIKCDSDIDPNCATVETELTSVEQCVNIDEECYVGISTDGVTTRGCKTKDDCDAYSNGLCTSCVNSDRCNDQLYPTDRLQCKQCKSGTEGDCASAPETLLATACQNYDDTELCYTILTDNHEVIRGCISDKHPETPEESECNSPNCITCDLAECNVHIIDVPQLTCIKCDSDIDPNCATVETELTSVEQCVNIDEECYVGISTDGVTTRGCKTKDDCDAYSNGLCTSCVNSDRCNDQLYPTDRLQCKQCKSGTEGDCASAPETLLATVCQNYDDTELCYTILTDNHEVIRGCISDKHPETPEESECNSPNCITCDLAECNVHIINVPQLTCIKCDSDIDPNCATVETELTSVEQCVNIDEECYVGISTDGVTTRGCKTKDDCDAYLNGLCTSCVNSNRCNDQLYPTDRLQCKQCKSGTEGDCASAPETLLATACQNYDDTELCYTILTDDREVIRGCISDKTPETPEESECDSPNCITCSASECNVDIIPVPPLVCIKCDSDVDSNCATLPTEITSVEPCVNIDEECFVGVSTTGVTIRGCITDIEFEKYPNGNAERCSDRDACNGNIFPDDRLKCLKCESTDLTCSSPATIETHSAVCQNYRVDDSCFTIVTGSTNAVTRGCISDKDAETKCSESDTCVQCDIVNCNIFKLKSEPSLSCIKCDQEDPKCEWGFANDDAVPCTTAEYLEEQELCYTYQNEDEIKRGCVLDDNTCMEKDESCVTCSGDGCNNDRIAESKCFICDTENTDESFCSSAITGEEFELCSDGNSAYGYRGCYTYKIDERVHRGCVSTLTDEELNNCSSADNLDCDICYDFGCNNREPNFASRLYYLSTSTLVLISLLAKLFN